MSALTWLAFVIGAAVGAPSRYVIDIYVEDRVGGIRPWGTLTVNAIGSLVLGVLTGLARHHGLSVAVQSVVGTGFCGALTTFSTFTYESVRLVQGRTSGTAAVNVAANVVVGFGLATIGFALASAG